MQLSSLPRFMKKEVDTLTSYYRNYPLYREIPFHDKPVEMMARECPDSSDNHYTPIIWKPEFIEPPYADFYKDRPRCVPKLSKGHFDLLILLP
eukprot:3833672-Amphidinium_carterae.1